MAPKAAVFSGSMDPTRAAWGIFSGVVFSIGNVLLVAAISLTGMAVAFPVCCGLALLIAVGLSLWINPAVPFGWMSLGAGMILVSMLMDAAAYRAMARNTASSTRGIVIAIIGGIFMGAFPPCSEKAFEGPTGLDAYSAAVMLGVGVLLCTILTNFLLMRRPITGEKPVPMGHWFSAPLGFHVLGILGGAIWAAGDIFYSIAANKVGAAMSYSFGMGGILVAAVWGVFVWKEFRGVPDARISICWGCSSCSSPASPSSPGRSKP